MIAIFKREFKSYFTGTVGFIFVAIVLAFMGLFATGLHLLNGLASFEYSLQSAVIVYLPAIPILTMRSLTEDKRMRTDRLLYSLPLKASHIIVGKYLAMLAVLAIPTAIVALYPLILGAFGRVNFVSAYACLFAFFMLGAALISLCMFLSSLAETQIIAAILGFGASFFLFMAKSIATMIPTSATVSFVCFGIVGIVIALIAFYLSKNIPIACAVGGICLLPTLLVFLISPETFEGKFPALLTTLALFGRFDTFSYGIFDISTLVLYISVAIFFVVLTVLAAEKKRWD